MVRLTAEDGYTASRSYSLASAPATRCSSCYVERLNDGEVSTHLADVVEPGDELELRGPVGGCMEALKEIARQVLTDLKQGG